jgi:glyoxylase-like metal-dependent hydrolase (beta-lactamase superfamily II)
MSAVSRQSWLRVAVLLVLCGCAWAAYSQGLGGPPKPSKLDTVKIADDLYAIHNDFVPGNVTAMITSEGVVLVDDKFEVDHDGILAELKKVTNQPVKYVINTHHHGDHSGGNAKLQAMGVQVVASEQARQNMVDAKQSGQPNVAIDRHAHIYLGGKTAEVFYFGRAHTNGDVVVLFPAQRTLAAGDMFTYGDATPQLIDYPGGGSAKEWTSTLDGALQLDFDTVVPGHGTVTTKQEMRKFRDSTLAVRNAVHDMIVDKKSKDEVWKMLQDRFHWAAFQAGTIDGMMAELR